MKMYRVLNVSVFVVFFMSTTFSADTSVKIVNGDNANIEDHPWQVSVQIRRTEKDNFTHICGGSIIDKSWVITAGHCNTYPELPVKNIRVAAGSSRLSQMKTIIPLKKFYKHTNFIFTDTEMKRDLMLLQLRRPLKFGSTINKIDLDTDVGKNYTGELCTISGWGNTVSRGENYPDRLQVVSMPVVTHEYCRTSWFGLALKDMICLQEGKKDSCTNDSGGPMVCSKKLVGVLSGGVLFCDGNRPSVYSRVSAYLAWIKETMNKKNKKNKKNKREKKRNKNKKEKKNNKNNKN
ncbi:trypsin-like [Mytilus galloprovincialis]|uniref:trypsin-like n=1 Tax=Mytilus galloprovincialis TaxID=29158 RepID=UPI003F7BFFA3